MKMELTIKVSYDLYEELKMEDAIITYILTDISYIYNRKTEQYVVEIKYIKDYNYITDYSGTTIEIYIDKLPSYQEIVNCFLEYAKNDFNNYIKNPKLYLEDVDFLENLKNKKTIDN